MARWLGLGVVALVALLLGVTFARALPDALEREKTGRIARIKAVCDEALKPDGVNPQLGLIPEPRTHVFPEAPDFTLDDWAGRPLQLSALRGRVVLLNFWFTTCPTCDTEMPSLEELARLERGKAFVPLAVSVDEDWPTVRKYFAKGSSLTVALDPQKDVPGRYGTAKFPETFLIDKDGRVLFYVVSDRNWSSPEVRQCIDAMVD